MTATAMPQDLAVRSWNTLLRMAAILAVLVMLAVGGFAFGRGSADPQVIVKHDAPAVDISASYPPIAGPDSCNSGAHTPPC
jgi:hypothetical protein